MSLLQDTKNNDQMSQEVIRVAQKAKIKDQTKHEVLPVNQDRDEKGQIPQQNIDPTNIEKENADHAYDRPIKKQKTSKLMDPKFDKDLNENSTSPSTTSNQNDDLVKDHTMSSGESSKIKTLSSDSEMIHSDTYEYLPQDYTLTDADLSAQIIIETSSEDEVLVNIDKISVKQHQLSCLLDQSKWLGDDVISASICCIKEQVHLQNMDDTKKYFENPFITKLFIREGNLGARKDGNYITDIVRKYLDHEMIFLPININNNHWYLAVLDARKPEIQVLDSLCWKNSREELTIMLKGIQNHLEIIQSQQKPTKHNWKDLHVTKWELREKLQEPIQKDISSCGLFVLKFMEYWTGDKLTHQITQENIILFRGKLAGILLCWKSNTAGMIKNLKEKEENEVDPDEVVILERPNIQNKTELLHQISVENKYYSIVSILSMMGTHELVGGLCEYIRSINCPQTLEKIWVQNSKPYSISLTLKKLQDILSDDMPMDIHTFNLVIRKQMFGDLQVVTNQRGIVSKHCLDLQFWMITDYGRHPDFRKKLDVERLAESVRCWPGISYSISTCKMILIPIHQYGEFTLFILDKDNRIVYILDPNPLDPVFQYNPDARYVKKILWIAEYLPKAMSIVCPGSRWNENIFLWRQKTINNVPIYKRELSGYIVSMLMSAWTGEETNFQFLMDGYEIRKLILGEILTYKENETEDNMPAGVLEFIKCIRKH